MEQPSPLNSSIDSAAATGSANPGSSGSAPPGPGSASSKVAVPAGSGSQGSGQGQGHQRPVGQSDDDSGCALEEYIWEPPGLKPDQVGKLDLDKICNNL